MNVKVNKRQIIDGVTIDLSEREAEVLIVILGNIGGHYPPIRDITSNLYAELTKHISFNSQNIDKLSAHFKGEVSQSVFDD